MQCFSLNCKLSQHTLINFLSNVSMNMGPIIYNYSILLKHKINDISSYMRPEPTKKIKQRKKLNTKKIFTIFTVININII